MRLPPLTIRARITGGSFAIAALISIAAGIVIYGQVQRIVTDGQLAVLQNVEAPYLTLLPRETTEEVDPPGAGQLVAVIAPSGSRSVDTLPSALGAQLDAIVIQGGAARTVAAGGASYIVRVTAVDTSIGTWQVVSARDSAVESAVLAQVAVLLVISVALINLGFAAASFFIGSAVLAPVGQLRRSAARLMTAPGREVLPVGAARDEISALATTLNELIAQLRASAERERQVVSDASHDLRTPLAILTTQLELAQAQATTLPELKSDVAAAQRTLGRLTSLASSMLELSRIDAQTATEYSTMGELAIELADAADRGRVRAAGRGIRIDYAADATGEPTRRVRVSVADFGRVCDNLIGNSLVALGADGGLQMTLSAAESGDRGCAVLTVSDDGGGMDAEFVPHALERFARSDEARTGGGAGLGLAIVAAIAALAGGSVNLINRPGEGLTVQVWLALDAVGARQAMGRPEHPRG